MSNIVTTNNMNYSYMIENEHAGHRGIQSGEYRQFLKEKGIKALIRMLQSPKVTLLR